ncbi:MAG: hypothetical protein ABI673_08495 [Novosphingobium sp.]
MMRSLLTRTACALGAAVLLASAPAHADFTIAKPKPGATTKPPETRRHAPRPRSASSPKVNVPTMPTGIDPALMVEVITQTGSTAKSSYDPATRTALIQATSKNIGWSTNFKDCTDANHCRVAELYTLWTVSNETNVCTVWGLEITKDPGRHKGLPYCYTLQPPGDRHLHLKLSSEQQPYTGVERMARPQARDVLLHMVGVWNYHLEMLLQAWKLAEQKCPKRNDNCVGGIRIKG